MSNPTDPGTLPQAPIRKRGLFEDLPQTLVFPNRGTRATIAAGPVGARAEDLPVWQTPPRLGWAGEPSQRLLTLISHTASPFAWVPYNTQRPVVLMPFRTNVPTGTTNTMLLRYAYGASAQSIVGSDVNSRHGFKSQRLACHLFAPGRWFLSLGGAADTSAVDFIEIPAEDRNVVEQLLFSQGGGGEGLTQQTSTVLAAGVANNVLELNQSMFLDWIRVVNAGANPVRLKWSGTPTATDGFGIAAGAFLDFPPETMAVSRLRGFSTAGTTVEVWGQKRQWAA